MDKGRRLYLSITWVGREMDKGRRLLGVFINIHIIAPVIIDTVFKTTYIHT